MGYEKLIRYFNKNTYNLILDLDDNEISNLIIATVVIFDMNFIIYTSLKLVENNINDIIKIILSIKYSYELNVIQKINKILNLSYWKNHKNNIQKILDGDTLDNIYNNFIKYLSNDNLNDIIFSNVLEYIYEKINKIHETKLIKQIGLFFDGIPTFSKIIEQRRRRMKKYFESENIKKTYNSTFSNLNNNIINEDELTYSYLEFLEYRYNINKNIGARSKILINLEKYLRKNFTKYNVYIDSTNIDGEADYKIYKYLDSFNYSEICIHSCDSDFIFLNLLFQLKDFNKSKNNSYTIINYSDTNNIINMNNLYNSILQKYKNINNLNSNIINDNIIYDLLFILTLFGNDILPNSLEIGIEIDLKLVLELHYKAFKNKTFIININKKEIINFNNLSIFFNKLLDINSSTIVTLNRYYKVSETFVNFLSNDLNLSVDLIENNFCKKLISKELTINEEKKNIVEHNYNSNNNTFYKLKKTFNINNNSYENLYNLITLNSNSNIDNKYFKHYPYSFDSLEELVNIKNNSKNFDTCDYLKVLISYTLVIFYDFSMYNSKLLFSYKYNISPPLKCIIEFIKLHDMELFQNNIYNSLSNYIPKFYFDTETHYNIISPYENKLKINYMLNDSMKLYSNTVYYSKKNKDTFNLRNINPLIFIVFYYYNKILNEIIKFNFNLLLL